MIDNVSQDIMGKFYYDKIRTYYSGRLGEFTMPLAHVRTFGCQQNVSDSERLKGMLSQMGFGFTENLEEANFIIFNTCAVREHAQDRVFGNVGALKKLKERRPDLIIAVCGCMVQQEHIANQFKESYPFVGLVFGTHVLNKFPELLFETLSKGKRVFDINDSQVEIVEDMPLKRDGSFKAWVPIMYGCNNFCTYCVVPYVRGRERSRETAKILDEVRELVQSGYREITLLGQNVNSYGKDLKDGGSVDFPKLLELINGIEGDFLIRFMTSHPKDATKGLIDTIAKCDKIERHFHLPFQSGSDRVLKKMNRGYTRASYLELAGYAKEKIPDIAFTSDVIVGFPGETREDFLETLSLIQEVEFASLFTFIFSPREGTPAFKMDDPVPYKEKSKWFQEMLDKQQEISGRYMKRYLGQELSVLVESDTGDYFEGRTSQNVIVRLKSFQNGGNCDESFIGKRIKVLVKESFNFYLVGEIL